MDLHCDNCSGQNKNRFMLNYLVWRVMCGLHTEITINFMPPGHTKFAPDWCFGLLKKKFRREEVHCLDDLARVVDSSTKKGVNRAQLVGTEGTQTEKGTVMVPVYDWHAFFQGWCKPLHGIKSLFHFRVSSAEQGVIFARKTLTGQEQRHQLVTDATVATQHIGRMPMEIPPPGLSEERKDYLRKNIRPFVKD